MNQKRRRVFAVTSSLQYRFLSLAVIYSFIIIFYFVIAINFMDIYQMQDNSLGLEVQSLAAERVIAHHSWIWPAAILLTIGLGLHSFLEFKKVIGPLYRFRWAFDQLENGSILSTVKLREKDHLVEEEKAFNKMLISLNGKMNTIKQEASAALKTFDELEKKVNKGSEWGTTQIESLQTHREHLEGLSSAVRFFRLQDEQQNTTVSTQNATKNGISGAEK
jgi:methyl-accepting chemotaxis protein